MVHAGTAVVIVIVLAGVHAIYASTLRNPSFLTGWTLFLTILFLACYQIRRRLPFLPLGSSSAWLQLHVYIGLVCAFLFGVHVDWQVPDGPFETVLAIAFAFVVASGLVGWLLFRAVPPRLSVRGENVVYERIPIYRRKLATQAEALAINSVKDARSTTIADYYSDQLHSFFDRPRNFWRHAMLSGRPRTRLLNQMRGLERYLDAGECAVMDQLADLVRTKDDLDFQYAMQSLLRRWQFVHVPVSTVLLILILVHIVLVYAFS